MRALIFAIFVVAYSEGRPGYEYSNPTTNLLSTHSTGIGTSGLFSNNHIQSTGFHGGVSSVGSTGFHGGVSSVGSTGFHGGVSSTGFHGTSNSIGGISTATSHHYHQQPIITKHFYIHSAPEEADEAVHKQIVVGAPRKNYRVVFIKAPSSRGSARISVVPSANEDKTVIYVLSKKADAADIQADVQPSTNVHSKPEVFFIKYKTQEEALHAQHQIQAQYDALGGSSHVSDEGVAPVTSVIGHFGGHVQSGINVGGHLHSGVNVGGGHLKSGTNIAAIATDVASGYLPPNKK